jgi:hypothetical protein
MKRLSKVLYLPELSESEFRLIAMTVLQRWQESTQFYIDDLEKLNVRCADHWLIGFDGNIVQKCINEIYTKEFEDWFNNNADTRVNGHLAGVPRLTAWHDVKKYALDAWLASKGL